MARPRRPQSHLAILFALVVVALVATYARFRHEQQAGPSSAPVVAVSPNLLLGNPSDATDGPSNKNNYLMIKPYFALSYNDSLGTPNWVSWRVTSDDLGNARRQPAFDPDNTLPPGFKRITHKDYSGSGFDRGHLCPHGDRAANEEMSFATFVMTNIIPQAPNVNEKAWMHLEAYCRDLAQSG